jgi:hypothetical protein
MKNYHLTAARLRVILTISIFTILAIAFVLATFAYSELKKVAIDVSHTKVDADASQNNIQTLQQIQQTLIDNKDVIERTNSIVADSQSYQYQDQILADLNDYANKAGITITNINFVPSTTTPTPGSTATAPPTGVKITSVSVTLKNPLNYNNLLRFTKSIEQNLTKMQISKVSLSKSTTNNEVTSDVLTIEVYIR